MTRLVGTGAAYVHGLRFQKRIKLFPGVHLNLSLSV